jgi:hypothetical protein
MTIKRYAGDRFVGLSTDPKPENVPDGAEFFESDTLNFFIKVDENQEQIIKEEFQTLTDRGKS